MQADTNSPQDISETFDKNLSVVKQYRNQITLPNNYLFNSHITHMVR